MHRSSFRSSLLVLLSVALFGCDHATKLAAKTALENGAAIPVAPEALRGAVELRYVENTDIAFNAFATLGVPRSPALLALLAVGVLALLTLAWVLAAAQRRRAAGAQASAGIGSQAGFALVVGGALGNLVDRIARGYVVDFIHVKGWPVFNVADAAVVAGAAIVVLARLREGRRGATGGPTAGGP